jgi:hypothetical protein
MFRTPIQANTFVPGNERRVRFDRPLSSSGMNIGVAEAGRFNMYTHFSRSWHGKWSLFNSQGWVEPSYNSSTHGISLPFWISGLLDFTFLDFALQGAFISVIIRMRISNRTGATERTTTQPTQTNAIVEPSLREAHNTGQGHGS